MAQVPWEKLTQKPVSEATAGEILSRCLCQLRRCSLYSASDGTGIDGAWIEQSEVVRQLRSVRAAVKRSQRLFSSRKTPASGLRDGGRDRSDEATRPPDDLRRSVFHVIRAKGMIQLLPRHLGNVKLGIQLYLLNFLLKYLPEFNGVWLAVDAIRVLQPKSRLGGVLSPLGYMIPDADTGGGVMLFEVELDCLVFKPKTNAMLIGRMQTVRPSHVRLLWLGLFSAVIPRSRLSPSYDIDKEQRKLQHKKGGADIEEGDLVCFQLTSYTQGSRAELLSLEGSLESGYAGLVPDEKSGSSESKREKKREAKACDEKASETQEAAQKSGEDREKNGSAKKKRRRQEAGDGRESDSGSSRDSESRAQESRKATSKSEEGAVVEKEKKKAKRGNAADREATDCEPSRASTKSQRASKPEEEETSGKEKARTGERTANEDSSFHSNKKKSVDEGKKKTAESRGEDDSEEESRGSHENHRKKRRK
ncbi:DNA-directed RNA polymerase I RPA43 [Toxoplasma gondii VAND]|uniref:DNA-directed RNA polymerase I RPA43 n=1 Tax=Toxoplasma gondii VAND TaxID=933077 RepID=A0A086QIJ0_TOXGO|nr:DNA-directed RNA polymerase I RPA43 [Toxoplasma gondii VAND]